MRPILIVGDTMLDVDIDGTSDRLSPEAPVPVVDIGSRLCRPGGAGLAAFLGAMSGQDIVLLTALGDDPAGRALRTMLREYVTIIDLGWLGTTVQKTRIRSGSLPHLRLDEGEGKISTRDIRRSDIDTMFTAGAVLVADYGRGMSRHRHVRRLLERLGEHRPVVWDPHPRGPAPVTNTTVACPNLREAEFFSDRYANPLALATRLRRDWGCTAVAVTAADRGAYLAWGSEGEHIASAPVGRAGTTYGPDACGAGDQFAIELTRQVKQGADLHDATHKAVDLATRFVAAGAASSVSQPYVPDLLGPAAPSGPCDAFALADRVRASGGTLVATGGCFDLLHPGHISLLRQARELGDALVVCLNSDESVRRLKGTTRPIITAAHRAMQLLELGSVDAVTVFDEPTPSRVLGLLRPHVWVKGEEYRDHDMPECSTVRRHGGDIAFIGKLGAYSTSRLLTAESKPNSTKEAT